MYWELGLAAGVGAALVCLIGLVVYLARAIQQDTLEHIEFEDGEI